MQFALNGKAFNVSPQQFDPDMEVEVDEGLGEGTQAQQQMEVLDGAAKAGMSFLSSMGPNNPICGLQEYYNIVTDLVKLGGFKDPSRYFANPSQAPQIQQMQQQGRAINPPPPSPEQIKAQSDQAIEEARLRKDRLQIVLEDERERYKLEIDAMLRAAEMNAKYGAHFDTKLLEAKMKREQMQSDERINQANIDSEPPPAGPAQ
jgi:hypothetical protein